MQALAQAWETLLRPHQQTTIKTKAERTFLFPSSHFWICLGVCFTISRKTPYVINLWDFQEEISSFPLGVYMASSASKSEQILGRRPMQLPLGLLHYLSSKSSSATGWLCILGKQVAFEGFCFVFHLQMGKWTIINAPKYKNQVSSVPWPIAQWDACIHSK